MAELSVFVDESGEQDGPSRYYLLTLVFHEQDASIANEIKCYEDSLKSKGLPNIPFHASPLMNGHDEYEGLELETRKRLLNTFNVFAQNLPVSYVTFCYKKHEVDTPQKLSRRMQRDLAIFVSDHLEYFLRFAAVKIYYDGGQQVVSEVLHETFWRTLSRQATMYRKSSFKDYRLAQVADYFCAIELALVKYESGLQTNTDIKIFGRIGLFKKNYLKQARRKLVR